MALIGRNSKRFFRKGDLIFRMGTDKRYNDFNWIELWKHYLIAVQSEIIGKKKMVNVDISSNI